MSTHPPRPPSPPPAPPPRPPVPWPRDPTAGTADGAGLDLTRLLLGLVVIAIGVLYLLERADVLDAGSTIDDWWPVAVIAMGLLQLVERTHGNVGPVLVVGAGILLLLATADVLKGDGWGYVWPAVLVAVGLSVIARMRPRVPRPRKGSDEALQAAGVFGGSTVTSGSPAFRGASLTAVFGGVVCDLRAARPIPEGAKITASAAFGGVEILVPRGWRIAIQGTPLFGGIDDKTEHGPDLAADAPLLRVDALALFGGVEVKHEK